MVFASCMARSQQLTMYHTFGGAHFEYQKDTSLFQVSPRQVSQILFDDPMAYQEFKKAKLHSTLSGILGFLGAGIAIIPVATAIVGGDPEWPFAVGGGALILASIPLGISYKNKAQNAVDIYNSKHSALGPRPQLFFSATGFRLVIRL